MITDGKPSVTTINNFLGLNMNKTGETQLKLGEASYMRNFRITKDFKLDKMYGYEEIYDPSAEVRAIWIGKLDETDVNVYVAGGKVYNGDTELGAITDDATSIFEFNKKLYFINGHEYKSWDGTTFGDVAGYIPKIKIATTPQGVGTDFEPINMLSDYRLVSFSADGTSTVYSLPETGISSVTAKVNGTTTSVTVQSSAGTVTFSSAPAQGVDNVEITYKKDNVPTSLKAGITKNKYFQTYGLADDTRVFLYGNEDAKNRIYFSDLGNGVPDVTYFPATNFIDVGSSNVAVTDISRQYDRLIVSKENEAYYTTYDSITDISGEAIITFPTYPLNKSHGMLAKGQGQLLDNYVTTVDASGIIQWLNTQSKDERNASIISERVSEWLQSRDVTKAITMDYQEEKEYWLAIDDEVLVYNYANSTFFTHKFADNVRSLFTYNGDIYFGTDEKVMKFNRNLTTYNGELIDAEWNGGFYDFDFEFRRKTMRILWITLKPQEKTYMKVNYVTDRNAGTTDKEIQNQTLSYEYWNYADFTYNSGMMVKPFKVKLKAKKFAFLKLIIKSDKIDYRLIVDSISIQKAYGGFVK